MRKKIAFQIIAVVAVIMVLFQIVSSIMLAQNAYDMYTKGKKELLGRDLKSVHDSLSLDFTSPLLFEYYENNLEDVKIPVDWNDEEFASVYESLENRYFEQFDAYLEESDFTDFSDAEKAAYARVRYKYISIRVDYYREYYALESCALVNISDGNFGSVVCDGTDEADDDALIKKILTAEKNANGTVNKYLNGSTDKPIFGNVSMGDDGDWFVCYYPMFGIDDCKYVLCFISDFGDFSKSLTAQILPLLLTTALLFILAVTFLIWFLYRKTVRPVTQIQSNVRKYTDDKDTDHIVQELSKVKVNNEFGVLAGDISNLALEIDRYNEENVKLTSEHQRIATELDLATKIQMDALPAVFPAFPERSDFDIYATMTPAKEVGGDFYDFFLLDDDHLALVIADVSGKGVPAALFMMMTKILIENYAKIGLSPKDVLERTNDAICRNNKEGMFVTVWFGILEISSGKITAVNAGHEYPVVRHGSGAFELIKDKHGFVIGAFENSSYREYEISLEKGDTLFLYTDGVPEATKVGNELFGPSRMLDALNKAPDSLPQQLLDQVQTSVNEFVGDAPQFDDLTMLSIKLL